MTIAEKILARASGRSKVEPGNYVTAKIDMAMMPEAFRLIRLSTRAEPHRANLTDDYSLVMGWALEFKKQEKIREWIDKNVQNAYIMVIDDYKNCEFENNWFPEETR